MDGLMESEDAPVYMSGLIPSDEVELIQNFT